jgi:hypothetical protein
LPLKSTMPYPKFQKMVRAYRRSFPGRGQGWWGVTGGSKLAIGGLGMPLRAEAFMGGEWPARAFAAGQGKSREVGREVGRMAPEDRRDSGSGC